jgi:hypothetical protein
MDPPGLTEYGTPVHFSSSTSTQPQVAGISHPIYDEGV